MKPDGRKNKDTMTTWIHLSVTDATQSHATLTGVVTGEHHGLTVSGPRTKEIWCTSANREMTLAELADAVRSGTRPRVRVSL